MEALVFNQVLRQHIVNVWSVIQVTCVNFNLIHVLQILAKMEVYAHLFSIQTVIIFTLAVVWMVLQVNFRNFNMLLLLNFLNFELGINCESIYNPCLGVNGASVCQNNGICSVNYNSYPYYQCSWWVNWFYFVISNLFKFNLFKKISLNGYSGTNCQIAPYVPLNCNDVDPVNCPSYAAQNYCKNIYSINGITLPNYCAKSCYTFSIKIVLLLIKS